MSLESDKSLGGIGAILVAIGSFFPILSLVGIILVLVAMKRFAEHYNEPRIFDNALYGFVFGIIGIVAAIFVFFMGIFTGAFFAFPVIIIVALVVMFAFFLLQAIYYRNAFNILSEKSGEKMFETAGLLLLIGAVLTIILVGLVLLLVAWILAAVGFFSIRTPTTQPPAPARPTPPVPPPPPSAKPLEPAVPVPVSAEKMYCRYCGTENKTDAVFCVKCGKKIA